MAVGWNREGIREVILSPAAKALGPLCWRFFHVPVSTQLGTLFKTQEKALTPRMYGQNSHPQGNASSRWDLAPWAEDALSAGDAQKGSTLALPRGQAG